MAKRAFSDTFLRSAKPPLKGQTCLWDEKFPCFGVRISQGGSKTFVLNRNNNFTTIGRFPVLSLAEARAEAKRILAEITLGKHRKPSISYAEAVRLFLDEKRKSQRARTVRDYTRLLGRVSFGPISEVTHDDVTRALRPFTAPSEYNHLLVVLRLFFNWCVKCRYVEYNPTMSLSVHARPPRARLLTDDEIRSIWKACDNLETRAPDDAGTSPIADRIARSPGVFSTIVKLLILTGQRRNEIASLRTEYIKDGVCTFPSALTKNKRDHAIPLGACGISIISSRVLKAGLLFPARGSRETPFNGWSKSKAALDRRLGKAVEPWTLHDIRRYYSSTMARLGVRLEVTERLLNHVSGTQSGVAGIYNRHTYFPEMREAVEKYESFLQSIGVAGD